MTTENEVKLFHTKTAIIIGVSRGRVNVQGMMGTKVENPVIVVVGGESISLMPMFTLTVEQEYFVPDLTLLYGVPMTPAPGLTDAYEKKYKPVAAAGLGGIELTTEPLTTLS